MTKNKIVTSARLAKLASKVLKGYEPTRDEVESLAACVLRQREKEIEANAVATTEPQSVTEVSVDAATVSVPVEIQVTPEVAATTETEIPAEPVAEKRGFWSNLFGGPK